MTVIDFTDKVMAYANALDSDITAERFEQVRDGKLWRGYSGAIYGCLVSTDKGYAFDTRAEALENARTFRERCREICQKVKLNDRPTATKAWADGRVHNLLADLTHALKAEGNR